MDLTELKTNPFTDRLKQMQPEQTPEQQPEQTPEQLLKAQPSTASAVQIAIVDGELTLTNIEQVWRAAKLIKQSGLCPPSFKNEQQLVIAILRALELKVPIFQALEGMSVINNRIGIMGDLALALVQGSGLLEKKSVEYTGENDELTCTLTLKRKGRAPQPYTFSVRDAKAAGIYERSSVWRGYPRRMTYYRALGFGLRDEFPDVLKGIKTIEELADYTANS